MVDGYITQQIGQYPGKTFFYYYKLYQMSKRITKSVIKIICYIVII